MFCIYTKSHRSVRIGAIKQEDTAYSLPSSNICFEKTSRRKQIECATTRSADFYSVYNTANMKSLS